MALGVKMGDLCLTRPVNLGYNKSMFVSIISFVLRLWLIVAVVVCVWKFVKPETRGMRLLRAALLVLGLLFVLTIVRAASE